MIQESPCVGRRIDILLQRWFTVSLSDYGVVGMTNIWSLNSAMNTPFFFSIFTNNFSNYKIEDDEKKSGHSPLSYFPNITGVIPAESPLLEGGRAMKGGFYSLYSIIQILLSQCF